MDYIILLGLIASSGLFSGLTIGLMGLSSSQVRRAADLGNNDAKKVLLVIKDSNLLLVTLLLGNTAVNATLSIFMSSVVGEGFIAGLSATVLILIFGEILPASLLSKHALKVGAKTSKLVLLLIKIFYPITKPIAYILDTYVGLDGETFFSKKELIYIVNAHEKSSNSDIDELDNKTLKGALLLDSKKVGDHMSKTVYSLDTEEVITEKLLKMVKKRGYTRIPVIKGLKVVGVLNVKNLIGLQKGNVKELMSNKFLTVNSEDKLDDVLSIMMSKNFHIAIVESYNSTVGIITLEDILEELLLTEIEDEFDNKE